MNKKKKILEQLKALRSQIVSDDPQVVFSGGVWNPDTDLNWAYQQIRASGKPAGDIQKYNDKARAILRRYVPSLAPEAAGELVAEVYRLTHLYNRMIYDELIEMGYSNREAWSMAGTASEGMLTLDELIESY